jgi:N-acetylmuramoyl-L-alanine amidase
MERFLKGTLIVLLAVTVAGRWAAAGAVIRDVRSHHYPAEGRTRVVIDCSEKTSYSVSEKPAYVVVTLLGAGIDTERERGTEGIPQRIRLLKVGKGAAAYISLRTPAQVRHFRVAPSGDNRNHRIVMDFLASGLAAEPEKRRKCIVLDPGHGGWNTGARGSGRYSSLVEKDIVLDISGRVRRLFEKNDRGGSTRVVMTRTADVLPFIPNGKPNQEPPARSQLTYRRRDLNGRVDFTGQKAAMYGRDNTIFVSLHCNWAKARTAHGYEVYVADDRAVASGEGRDLVERENAGGGGAAIDPRLAAAIRSDAKKNSRLLASSLLQEFWKVGGMAPHGPNQGLHEANFMVLRTLDCPAVLVEIGYLSNYYDAKRLASSSFRDEVAISIYNAIVDYFRKRDGGYPLGFAALPKRREYTVRSGDTLVGIARQFNISYRQIMQENGMRKATIYPGQVLRIPH